MATAIQILKTLDVPGIKDRLMAFPAELAQARMAEANLRQAVDEAKQMLAARDAELRLEVTTETNIHGKPVYSNAEAREAAVTSGKQKDPTWLAWTKDLKAAQQALDTAQMRRQQLDEQFSAFRTLARLVTAEIMLLAGDGAAQEV